MNEVLYPVQGEFTDRLPNIDQCRALQELYCGGSAPVRPGRACTARTRRQTSPSSPYLGFPWAKLE